MIFLRKLMSEQVHSCALYIIPKNHTSKHMNSNQKRRIQKAKEYASLIKINLATFISI